MSDINVNPSDPNRAVPPIITDPIITSQPSPKSSVNSPASSPPAALPQVSAKSANRNLSLATGSVSNIVSQLAQQLDSEKNSTKEFANLLEVDVASLQAKGKSYGCSGFGSLKDTITQALGTTSLTTFIQNVKNAAAMQSPPISTLDMFFQTLKGNYPISNTSPAQYFSFNYINDLGNLATRLGYTLPNPQFQAEVTGATTVANYLQNSKVINPATKAPYTITDYIQSLTTSGDLLTGVILNGGTQKEITADQNYLPDMGKLINYEISQNPTAQQDGSISNILTGITKLIQPGGVLANTGYSYEQILHSVVSSPPIGLGSAVDSNGNPIVDGQGNPINLAYVQIGGPPVDLAQTLINDLAALNPPVSIDKATATALLPILSGISTSSSDFSSFIQNMETNYSNQLATTYGYTDATSFIQAIAHTDLGPDAVNQSSLISSSFLSSIISAVQNSQSLPSPVLPIIKNSRLAGPFANPPPTGDMTNYLIGSPFNPIVVYPSDGSPPYEYYVALYTGRTPNQVVGVGSQLNGSDIYENLNATYTNFGTTYQNSSPADFFSNLANDTYSWVFNVDPGSNFSLSVGGGPTYNLTIPS